MAKKKIRLTPIPAIHKYCMGRCLTTAQEVTKCDDIDCPLYEFRNGHNPTRKGIGRKKDRTTKSGQFIPSQDGKKRILETISEGRKRIKIIVEDINENQ